MSRAPRGNRVPYASKAHGAIEIEASRLVMVYVRDSRVEWQELERAWRTTCENVLMAVDRTDLISVYSQ